MCSSIEIFQVLKVDMKIFFSNISENEDEGRGLAEAHNFFKKSSSSAFTILTLVRFVLEPICGLWVVDTTLHVHGHGASISVALTKSDHIHLSVNAIE